jgi:hypothetical protein
VNPSTQLKRTAILFAVLWSAGMVWWGGSFTRGNVVLTAIDGAVVGYAWYRTMRWYVARRRVPSRSARLTVSAAEQ